MPTDRNSPGRDSARLMTTDRGSGSARRPGPLPAPPDLDFARAPYICGVPACLKCVGMSPRLLLGFGDTAVRTDRFDASNGTGRLFDYSGVALGKPLRRRAASSGCVQADPTTSAAARRPDTTVVPIVPARFDGGCAGLPKGRVLPEELTPLSSYSP